MPPSPRLRLTSLIRLALLATLVAAAIGAVSAASARPRRLSLTGFQSDFSPVGRIDRSARALTRVGVDGINLVAHGAAVSRPSVDALAQLRRAHTHGLAADLLVGNYSNQVNDFSEPLAHALLARASNLDAVVASITRLVTSQGWNGVTLDLESLEPRDTAGLTALLARLRSALPLGVRLTICLQNAATAAGFAAQGYDLAAIGRRADRVVLMAYDDHGPWENQPGPIGPLAWQRAGLHALLRWISAAKVQLGVGGYGYGWRPHANLQYSDAQARALVARDHARARWVPGAGEWTAQLPDGSTLWWSDARSFALRVALARSLHLDGLAVWSLGLSDPLRLH